MQDEKGTRVVCKLTQSKIVMGREMSIRQKYGLSHNYVPPVISVHYIEKQKMTNVPIAQPMYCITIQAADTALENYLAETKLCDVKDNVLRICDWPANHTNNANTIPRED